MNISRHCIFTLITALTLQTTANATDEPSLGNYFGFEELEIIKIGDGAGPMYIGEINGDGLMDILVVNNHKSRIDVLLQKAGATPQDATPVTRANEIPEHWRFNNERIMVSHKVSALALHDFNNDGRTDVIYAGNPNNIVFLAQEPDGTFTKTRTHRTKNLRANRSGFQIANIIGDNSPELLTIVEGNIQSFPLDEDSLGKPVLFATEDSIAAFELADYDGDGLLDISGIIPNSSEPVRLWLSQITDGEKMMGPQLRFEMPTLREFASVSLPNRNAALMAIIERASRKIVLYEITREQIKTHGDRDASIEIYPFLGKGARKHLIVDVNSDGLLDLIATNPSDNTIVVYEQTDKRGLSVGVSSPTLSDVRSIATGDIDKDGVQELYVLSEDEGVVGRSELNTLQLPFPQPIPFSSGNTPISLSTVQLNNEMKVAVISKEKRSYVIDLIDAKGNSETIDLGSLSRGPDQILGFDADQDGRTDLLVLTRDKPMKLIIAAEDGFDVLDDNEMGQFGLVREATEMNISIFDVDNDANPELLIVADNYVRAVRYEPNPEEGVSPGWQVVTQVNLEDGASDLISIAVSGDNLYVADRENERVVAINRNDSNEWEEADSLFVHGYDFGPMYCEDFTGDGTPDIIAMSNSGFAIIQIEGDRIKLHELQSWRSENERRVQHELAMGDVNSDGYSDMVSLDAGEQMLEIFTFSQDAKMLYATGFKIFESRIFSSGEPREWQPSQVIITDLTNDNKSDVLLLSHDRLILYKQ
ncbi:MAG: VCBS repeat-containing protein [Phycisphaerales bacterium]|nr:VCBS repeat-containing protein [Planctomycetota bacterium]MBL6997730.1 VCBS repeat-containing protein [Phycisphaerales bacterium]